MNTISAIASPNIALIKYWGNTNNELRLPANSSISITLNTLQTKVKLTKLGDDVGDALVINGLSTNPSQLSRVTTFIDHFRKISGITCSLLIETESNFPAGAGIASSASAFAAIGLAVTRLFNLNLTAKEMSAACRLGSGSASRSIPGGFVEWHKADTHEQSYAETIYPSEHWELVDIVCIINDQHKMVGSSAGHKLAATSQIFKYRLDIVDKMLKDCRMAISTRDFDQLACIAEEDAKLLHAIAATSTPPILYLEQRTISILRYVKQLRGAGLPVFYTLDAGPNPHIITTKEYSDLVFSRLSTNYPEHRYLQSGIGNGATLTNDD